jgi:DNA-binding XRE family transcriptional regulator
MGKNSIDREKLISNMTENLPALRAQLDLTQEELAGIIGVSRSTVLSIENKKRDMTWGTFLSLVLLFTKNEETNKLLNVMEIYTDEFHAFIQRPSADGK